MKKRTKILLFLLLLFVLLQILTNCRYMYADRVFTVKNMHYTAHDLLPVCFADAYFWKGSKTDAVVDIPDQVEGYCVTSLGGHAVSPLLVNLPHRQYICREDSVPEGAEIEQYHLVLNIGRNIREAEYIEMDCYHCVGTNQFVQILVSVSCAEDNPSFYSENGKLYKKSNDALVEGFFYYSDYAFE